MKAIYSIKQLRHSSNVGGATQHNGWHRATGHIADTVEISKSSRISRPARQVIADQVATSGRSDGQGASCGLPKCRSARRSTCSRKSEAKCPARIFDELNASNS